MGIVNDLIQLLLADTIITTPLEMLGLYESGKITREEAEEILDNLYLEGKITEDEWKKYMRLLIFN